MKPTLKKEKSRSRISIDFPEKLLVVCFSYTVILGILFSCTQKSFFFDFHLKNKKLEMPLNLFPSKGFIGWLVSVKAMTMLLSELLTKLGFIYKYFY